MTAAPLSDRERRMVAGAAVLLTAAMLIRFVVTPVAGAVATARAEREREEHALARERALLDEAQGYTRQVAELGDRYRRATPRLLEGASPAAAQAALAAQLEAAAAALAVLLTRLEPLPPRSSARATTALPLRVEGEAELADVLTLWAVLQAGPRLIDLEDASLRVRSARTPTNRETAVAASAIEFQFTAVGFVRALPRSEAPAHRSPEPGGQP